MSIHIFELDSAFVLRAHGPGIERYLQNRLTQDIKKLADGHTTPAAALSAQGRVQGVFTVLRRGKEFLLASDGGDPAEVAAAVKKFKVSEPIEVDPCEPPLRTVHLFGAGSGELLRETGLDAPRNSAVFERDGTLVVARNRTGREGYDIIASHGEIAALIERLEGRAAPIAKPHFEALRITAGVPLFPVELNDQMMLIEAGMPELVSFTKGCYVGQEVVAKVDALGKPPRLLYRLSVSAPPESLTAAPVLDAENGKQIGKVLSAAGIEDQNGSVCFALLRSDRDYSAARLEVHGTSAALLS